MVLFNIMPWKIVRIQIPLAVAQLFCAAVVRIAQVQRHRLVDLVLDIGKGGLHRLRHAVALGAFARR